MPCPQALDVHESPNTPRATDSPADSSSGNEEAGSDDFESASETDWELRPPTDVQDLDLPGGLPDSRLEAGGPGRPSSGKRGSADGGGKRDAGPSSRDWDSKKDGGGASCGREVEAGRKEVPQLKGGGAAQSSKGGGGLISGLSKIISNLTGDAPPSTESVLPVLARVQGSWLSHIDINGRRWGGGGEGGREGRAGEGRGGE